MRPVCGRRSSLRRFLLNSALCSIGSVIRMPVHDKNTIPVFGGDMVRPCDLRDAEMVILPFCYEQAPSYGPGSLDGPLHILAASEQLESFDEELLVDWATYRIHTIPPVYPSGDPKTAVSHMQTRAAAVLEQKKFMLVLGGDHAVSIGPMAAAAELFPDIGVLQVDAHLDLRNEWNGSIYNHACVMRRALSDLSLPVTQVGIRSFSVEEAAFVKQNALSPFYAHAIDALDNTWMDQVIRRLPENVYVTVDLDGLDPSVIPGTGTPEPGGLTYRQLIRLLAKVAQNRKIIAADITELAKMEGTQVSEFTAARIAAKMLVYGKTYGAFL